MNIAITPTAKALIQQLIELGHDNPQIIIEQALQYFYTQQLIDTMIEFPDVSEAEIIQDNEKRWQEFQQNPDGIPHAQAEAWFANRNKPS